MSTDYASIIDGVISDRAGARHLEVAFARVVLARLYQEAVKARSQSNNMPLGMASDGETFHLACFKTPEVHLEFSRHEGAVFVRPVGLLNTALDVDSWSAWPSSRCPESSNERWVAETEMRYAVLVLARDHALRGKNKTTRTD